MFQMIQTLKRLISAKSTSEVGELSAAQVVNEACSGRGLESHIEAWDGKRANVIARLKSTGELPGLLFLAHLDVVSADEQAWHTPPFEAVEQGDRVYGRGAVDMKGGLAAVIEAMGRVARKDAGLKGDVHLAAVAGEETDSAGIERLMSQTGGLGKLAGVIICEPTALRLVTTHRGMLWVKITTLGKSAHGSMPHIGINAIESMLSVLERIRRMDAQPVTHPRLGSGTISINRIYGGTATNIIPEVCCAEVDARMVPGQTVAATIESFKRVVNQLQSRGSRFRAKLDILKKAEALETDEASEFVQCLCRATGITETSSVGFTTDGPWLQPLGIPIVVFGPGDPELCHKSDEYIEVAELERAAAYYEAVISHLVT